jgi:IS30 family transposase
MIESAALTSDIEQRRSKIKELIEKGHSQREVAKMFDIDEKTVRRDLKFLEQQQQAENALLEAGTQGTDVGGVDKGTNQEVGAQIHEEILHKVHEINPENNLTQSLDASQPSQEVELPSTKEPEYNNSQEVPYIPEITRQTS